MAASSRCEIRRLGSVPYNEAWDLQQRLLAERAADSIPDTLLLLEHPHVITLGRKTPGMEALKEKKEWQGVPLFLVERGGEATYHGPGQLVAYPIFRLPEKLGPKGFLRMLEQAIIRTLKDYDLEAFAQEGATGVWLKDAQDGRDRKIASLGIAVRQGVSYHGLALNVTTDLKYFSLIQPCGFAPSVMTSMAEQGVRMRVSDAEAGIARHLQEIFYAAAE